MNKTILTGISILFLFFFGTIVNGQSKIQKIDNLKKFSWLTGIWKCDNSPENTIEEWNWVNDTLLKGRSYTIKLNDTIINEQISIVKTINGIFYIAEVVGQNNGKAVRFKLAENADKNLFRFENLSHDFPTSVNYLKLNKKSLFAWIEGYGKRIDFKMKKIK